MKLENINISEIIHLRKNLKYEGIYDILLNNVDELKRCDTVECHFVLYPYDRRMSSDHIEFNPFEEYINDIVSEHRSVYVPIVENTHKIFGLFLGGIILLVFMFFKPEILISVESIVSIFAAYTVGKEIWNDIQNSIIKISTHWKISYVQNYYSYQLEKRTTLTRYSTLARKRRLEITPILPKKMDFIFQSNSQTLRLKFDSDDLRSAKSKNVHLFSIRVSPEKIAFFEQTGYLFGVKISFNKYRCGFKKSYELFQSLNGEQLGCLNENEQWFDNKVFYRNTFSYGRIKYFKSKGEIDNQKLIKKID